MPWAHYWAVAGPLDSGPDTILVVTNGPESGWYAVRCVFSVESPPRIGGQIYEERVTLWQASTADEAIERAETEARQYAAAIEDSPSMYLGVAQSFRLFDSPGDGAEVFSLMRTSDLGPSAYLDAYFDSGTEHQQLSP
jgi:hypothetical protein